MLFGGNIMRIRKQPLGDANIVGVRVEQYRHAIHMKQKDLLAQLQVKGIEMNASGLSKLEGQIRHVSDYELVALSEILGVPVTKLLGIEK
jgi:transcriptional regulator with XRE-family HTH domain